MDAHAYKSPCLLPRNKFFNKYIYILFFFSQAWKDLQRTEPIWSSVVRRRTSPRPPRVKASASPSLPNHFVDWAARFYGACLRQTNRCTMDTSGGQVWRQRWDNKLILNFQFILGVNSYQTRQCCKTKKYTKKTNTSKQYRAEKQQLQNR